MKVKKEKSKIKKIVNIVEYSIVILVILINALFIFKSIKNPNKTPDLFGKKAFIIVSGSMLPKIQIGDIVITKNTNKVSIDEIIAFREKTEVIVHRIVGIDKNEQLEETYKTKGDNNNSVDMYTVKLEDIEGVYIGKIPYLGNVLMFLYKNLSFVLVFIVMFLIIKIFLPSGFIFKH